MHAALCVPAVPRQLERSARPLRAVTDPGFFGRMCARRLGYAFVASSGLRELRAPLAAGFVWMVAVWFAFEPRWDRADHNDGFVASANRLIATVNLLGQAVVLPFVAYLLGSFSVFVFSRILLARLHPSLWSSGRVLEGLSDEGRASLWQVAYESLDRIEEELTLSGVPVNDVLRARLDSDGAGANGSGMHAGAPAKSNEEPALRVEQEAQAELIASGVLRNLAVVANTQLLGKEPDVFAAVDRNKAEVEFRVALVPALVGLALTIGVTLRAESWWAALLALLLGMLGAVGLLLDAARGRRDANEMPTRCS